MIASCDSYEEAMQKLWDADKAEDPITSWELTRDQYYKLKSAPEALKYFWRWKGDETILGLPYTVKKC